MNTEIIKAKFDALEGADTAKLPVSYEQASQAIAECVRIDECKSWSDKAEALRSYARQSRNKEMEKDCMRIRARAIRRCGELLKQIEPAGKNHLKQYRQDGTDPTVTRTQAAADAGLSERQRKQALRIASIPGTEFTEAIYSDDPPTITALEEAGTKKKSIFETHDFLKGRTVDQFKMQTRIRGFFRDAAEHEEDVCKVDPRIAAECFTDDEVDRIADDAIAVCGWMNEFLGFLMERKKEIEK